MCRNHPDHVSCRFASKGYPKKGTLSSRPAPKVPHKPTLGEEIGSPLSLRGRALFSKGVFQAWATEAKRRAPEVVGKVKPEVRIRDVSAGSGEVLLRAGLKASSPESVGLVSTWLPALRFLWLFGWCLLV